MSAAKTGTAEKVVNGRYSKTRLLTTFMAVFPADSPRYLVTIILDEPQPTKETHGLCDLGLERGADGGRCGGAHCAHARCFAALQSAAGRQPDSCGDLGCQVTRAAGLVGPPAKAGGIGYALHETA